MRNRNQRLFCSQGKTECELEKMGCLCGQCPIQGDYGLTEFYYCAEGAAKK